MNNDNELRDCKSDDFFEVWHNVIHNDRVLTERWIKELYEQGVKCAHPNNGWVNREENYVIFSNPYRSPYLNDNPKIGDIIAIGDYREYRLVQIVNEESLFSDRHYFIDYKN